jgi:hypothetical protein
VTLAASPRRALVRKSNSNQGAFCVFCCPCSISLRRGTTIQFPHISIRWILFKAANFGLANLTHRLNWLCFLDLKGCSLVPVVENTEAVMTHDISRAVNGEPRMQLTLIIEDRSFTLYSIKRWIRTMSTSFSWNWSMRMSRSCSDHAALRTSQSTDQ